MLLLVPNALMGAEATHKLPKCEPGQVLVPKCNGEGNICTDLDFCFDHGTVCRDKWIALKKAGATGLLDKCPEKKERCKVAKCPTPEPTKSRSYTASPTSKEVSTPEPTPEPESSSPNTVAVVISIIYVLITIPFAIRAYA